MTLLSGSAGAAAVIVDNMSRRASAAAAAAAAMSTRAAGFTSRASKVRQVKEGRVLYIARHVIDTRVKPSFFMFNGIL